MPPNLPPPIKTNAAPVAGLAVASLVLGILSLTCFSVLTGLPAVILGIMALSRVSDAKGAVRGKGQAIAGLVTGGLSLLLLPITAALLLPAFTSARAKAQEVACMNNVKQCVIACTAYAAEHDGKLPEKWDDLEGVGALRCPRHTSGSSPSYELLAPGRKLADLQASSAATLIREIEANHRGRRVVGYADGHVDVAAD